MNLDFRNVFLSWFDFDGQIDHDASKPHWIQMLEQILKSEVCCFSIRTTVGCSWKQINMPDTPT